MIEYLIHPGANADDVLRNSLVGRMDFAWGQITATIVDTIDPTQEDRLRLAKFQPGVWLANPTGMVQQTVQAQAGKINTDFATPLPARPPLPQMHRSTFPGEPMDATGPPPTGPLFTRDDAALAAGVERLGGLKLVYTLALALQGIAEELVANSEPEKFLTAEECLRLANALMHRIPDDWHGDQPAEETPSPTLGDA